MTIVRVKDVLSGQCDCEFSVLRIGKAKSHGNAEVTVIAPEILCTPGAERVKFGAIQPAGEKSVVFPIGVFKLREQDKQLMAKTANQLRVCGSSDKRNAFKTIGR